MDLLELLGNRWVQVETLAELHYFQGLVKLYHPGMDTECIDDRDWDKYPYIHKSASGKFFTACMEAFGHVFSMREFVSMVESANMEETIVPDMSELL